MTSLILVALIPLLLDWKQGHWQQPRQPATGGQWSPHWSFEQNIKCRLYFSFGHTSLQYAQFRSSGHQPSAHLTVGPVFSPTWFLDTGANQHVTPDLATMTGFAPYLGNDHLHVGDGKDLSIYHIGDTMLHSSKRTFTLSNVLHVPHITKPLLSVYKFYCDNNIYFEFHAFVFYVKDLTTKVVLLSG
jgi:hypothetical protein